MVVKRCENPFTVTVTQNCTHNEVAQKHTHTHAPTNECMENPQIPKKVYDPLNSIRPMSAP